MIKWLKSWFIPSKIEVNLEDISVETIKKGLKRHKLILSRNIYINSSLGHCCPLTAHYLSTTRIKPSDNEIAVELNNVYENRIFAHGFDGSDFWCSGYIQDKTKRLIEMGRKIYQDCKKEGLIE